MRRAVQTAAQESCCEGGRETGLGGEITLCACAAEDSSPGEKLGEGGKNGACCSTWGGHRSIVPGEVWPLMRAVQLRS